MQVLTKALIKKSEEDAVNSGAFSFRELMYNAGSQAAKIIAEEFDIAGKKISVVCGKGNNGGDGCVVAEMLSNCGAEVTVVTPFGAPKTENAAYYYNNLTVNRQSVLPKNQDFIIDAIFGTGLDRILNDEVISLIEEINKAESIRISLDIPSGVETDGGKIMGGAVYADLTVTFIALKPCFLLPEGSEFCGKTLVADIGVKPCGYSYLTTEEPQFKKRPRNSHKGTFGTGLIFCGSYGMAGAAVLAAKAALRSGIGILKAVINESIYIPFTVSVPEAVCVPVKPNEKGTYLYNSIAFENILKKASAILIGCGIGKGEDNLKIIKTLCEKSEVPIVIDADGINSLTDSIDIIKKSNAPIILTPHPAEMARLISKSVSEVEQNRISVARDFAAKYGCVLVLKGANTLIATPEGEIYFNTTGNPGMATGGSGDVLSGIILSLLSQGLSPVNAAKSGVYLHGKAGDKAAEKYGERAMLPTDMIGEL